MDFRQRMWMSVAIAVVISIIALPAANAQAQGATTLSGDEVFRLSDTFGFPAEMTAELARERGLDVDMEGYQAALQRQRQRSRRVTLADRASV